MRVLDVGDAFARSEAKRLDLATIEHEVEGLVVEGEELLANGLLVGAAPFCLAALAGANHLIHHIKIKSEIQSKLQSFTDELAKCREELKKQDEKTKEAISYVSNFKLQTSLRKN